MKFRKKPVVIEATQWWPGIELAGVCTVKHRFPYDPPPYDGEPHIHTLEGPHLVSPGDWIITGVEGERYACKPRIFEKTYEPAEPTTEKSHVHRCPVCNRYSQCHSACATSYGGELGEPKHCGDCQEPILFANPSDEIHRVLLERARELVAEGSGAAPFLRSVYAQALAAWEEATTEKTEFPT